MGDGADDAERSAFFDEMDAKEKINKIWKKELFNMEFSGKVKKITKEEIKTGANIGKPFYKVVMEDVEGEEVLFNAWSYEAIKDIKVGYGATLDYTPKGQYRHINRSVMVTDINDDPNDIFKRPMENAIETPAPAVRANLPINPDSRELGIYRQSALKGAIEYAAGQDLDIEAVIELAKRFVQFDLTGE